MPVSQDAGDVLRELVAARVHLHETVTALRALTTAAPPGAGVPDPAVGIPGDGLPDAAVRVLEEALGAVARVDAATAQVMRERRPRS
ncbi:hypothetical protein ACFWWM_38430 [Streptomyces sp. NPDC058682]|uniref:hypothetical protein n=1 Tax=Streptomyces sp. NPDC058682 TaxID=3346596 RepID=UPI00364B893B